MRTDLHSIVCLQNHVNRSTSHGLGAINEQMLATVFKWEGSVEITVRNLMIFTQTFFRTQTGGGKEVFITGTFSDWKPIKMVQSQGDFVTVHDIPEVRQFRKQVSHIKTFQNVLPF